jgi:hypothetical protein
MYEDWLRERSGRRRDPYDLPSDPLHGLPPSPFYRPVTREVRLGLLSLGQLVYDGRRRLYLSQDALERASGLDQTVISRLERGLLLSLRLERLARVFGVLYPARPPDR